MPRPTPDDAELFPERKHLAHGIAASHEFPTVVFLTVCSDYRVPWFADESVHQHLREVWMEARAWRVGRYVVMPDHLHLFCTPGEPELPLDNWVRYWKSQFTKSWQHPEHRWQADHWDTRLRSWDQYAEKSEYVRFNPVRKKLCARPEDWVYQGELNQLW